MVASLSQNVEGKEDGEMVVVQTKMISAHASFSLFFGVGDRCQGKYQFLSKRQLHLERKYDSTRW